MRNRDRFGALRRFPARPARTVAPDGATLEMFKPLPTWPIIR